MQQSSETAPIRFGRYGQATAPRRRQHGKPRLRATGAYRTQRRDQFVI
jgi:hypothetical protein